jgi:hypothetical protein
MLTQFTLCAQSETMAHAMHMSLRAMHAYTPGMPRHAKPGKRLLTMPMRRARA